MEVYLTKKAQKKENWKWIPVAFAMLVLGATAAVLVDYAGEGDIGGMVLCIILMIPLSIPLVRMIRGNILKKQARQVAGGLRNFPGQGVPFSELDTVLGIKDAGSKIRRLLDDGYLHNMQMDRQRSQLILLSPDLGVRRNIYIKIRCEHCGAETMLIRGRLGKCPYCDQVLVGEESGIEGK